MTKCGSHVVEKYITSIGMNIVVSELLSDIEELFEVALDLFGNYVIQTSLNVTKVINFLTLLHIYQSI